MIGERIRTLREANNLLLRQLAARLEIDQAMLSKMERGERAFRKEDIYTLSDIFKESEKELLTLWLADKITKNIANEEYKLEAIDLVRNELN